MNSIKQRLGILTGSPLAVASAILLLAAATFFSTAASAATLPLVTKETASKEIYSGQKPVLVLVVFPNRPCPSCDQTESLLADAAIRHPTLKFAKVYCGDVIGCIDEDAPARVMVWNPRPNYFSGAWSFSQRAFQPKASDIDAFLSDREHFMQEYFRLSAEIRTLRGQLKPIRAQFEARIAAAWRANDVMPELSTLTSAQRSMNEDAARGATAEYAVAESQFNKAAAEIARKSKAYQDELSTINAEMAIASGTLPAQLELKEKELARIDTAEAAAGKNAP